VDDDAATRWTTGTGQAPGQSLQLDLGSARRLGGVVLDSGAGTGDYPRGYTAATSTDGTHWTTVAADATGTGQLTTIPLDGRATRYVRVTLTASSGSWWSVADVRAYAATSTAGHAGR
jgi:glucosylceramidase